MTSLKPVIRELREAVLDGMGHASSRLHHLADNLDDHFDTVIRQVKDKDTFDDKPDAPTRRPGDGTIPETDTRRHGVDRGDGRDDYGKFVSGDNRQWVDKEQLGLDEVAQINGLEVHRVHVRATIEGHRLAGAGADQGRYYDGLMRNPDGTYTGIEVKSGSASRNAAQRDFDGAVSPDTPAFATLNGERIRIVQVILKEVP